MGAKAVSIFSLWTTFSNPGGVFKTNRKFEGLVIP